jgi:hypothetical protein
LAKWIATVVLAVLMCGCGSDKQNESAALAATPTPEPLVPEQTNDDVEEEYHQPPKPASGGVGDTITLTGSNIGVRLRVTVTGVERAGRYTAVNMQLKNTGIAVFESELRGAQLRYADGKRARPVLGVEARCSRGFHAGLRLEVGLRTRGCVLFRRPTTAAPGSMKLALESNSVAEGGLWRLG